ncbi:hypothetical protein BDR26DRAFT_834744 [Obelidium mucronatum]|nr:hypothetical protein BDR26DRAFT_834744 [Obelidium mucronatum]
MKITPLQINDDSPVVPDLQRRTSISDGLRKSFSIKVATVRPDTIIFDSEDTIGVLAEESNQDPAPLSEHTNEHPVVSVQMYMKLLWHILFPTSVICVLFLVPLTEPSAYWQSDQISNTLVFFEACLVVFVVLPIVFLNVQTKLNHFVLCWQMVVPVIVGFLSQMILTVFLPYWLGVFPVPFLFWGIGPALWASSVLFSSYYFVKEMKRRGVDVAGSDLYNAFRVFLIPLSAAVGVYGFFGLLVIIKFSHSWYTLLGISFGFILIRNGLKAVCYEIVKAPYGRHSEGWLEIFFSSVSFTWFKFALPEIDDYGMFAFASACDCLVLVAYGIWMVPSFEKWMLSEPNPRAPFRAGEIILKCVERMVMWLVKVTMKKHRNPKPVQKKIDKNWRILARTGIFSLLWSHLSATAVFICFYSVVIFTPNGHYMAFYTSNLVIWNESIVASVIFIIVQILTIVVLMQVGKRTASTTDYQQPTQRELHLFEHGILLFQIPKHYIFVWTIQMTTLVFINTLFLKQAGTLYSFYSHH